MKKETNKHLKRNDYETISIYYQFARSSADNQCS